MSVSKIHIPAIAPESIDSILAKNLMAARQAAGVTQQALAGLADVSRATIAQIETGYSDPRLSTIVDLARALGVSPIVLLSGVAEVQALVGLPDGVREQTFSITPDEELRMRRMVASGMLKDRLRAARVGATAARNRGHFSESAVVAAAIFSAIVPTSGTHIGAIFGSLLASACTPPESR